MGTGAFRGPSYQDAIALATRMNQNPADSVTLASQLSTMLQNLPPPAGVLLSRPRFERASLWSLGCSFENIGVAGLPPPQVIRAQHDIWVRGVQAQAYPLIVSDDPDAVQEQLGYFRFLADTCGRNGRCLFDVNWRLDARQGFISSGSSEILGPGSVVTGDGFWSAPMDWRLQKDQTIEVRIANRMNQVFPTTLDEEQDITDANRVLRWVVVTFWCEELDQPSVMQ